MDLDLFITTGQLSKRWNIQMGTLRLWRWYGKGPLFTKLGGRIRYDIEGDNLRSSK